VVPESGSAPELQRSFIGLASEKLLRFLRPMAVLVLVKNLRFYADIEPKCTRWGLIGMPRD
jgi:hypothetical protein